MTREVKYKDASMINPAVKAYRDKFHKCPNAGLRKDIVVTVQDLALWLRILNGWRYQVQDRWKAKNPLAVKEMLTEYERLDMERREKDSNADALSPCNREGLSSGRGSGLSSVRSETERLYFRA